MENRIKSVFGDYATALQVLVDENLDRFKEPFFPKYFTMGTPQNGLSYATAIGRSRIEAAASVVAHGSEAPMRSRAGLEKLSGEVAAIKVKRKMDESEYRNWMVLQGMPVSDETKKQQIIQLIWDDVKHVIDSVRSRVDIMVKQALSTGNVNINLASNPDGINLGDINLLRLDNNSGVPGSRNGTTAAFENTGTATYWSDNQGTSGGEANPLTDIQYVVEENPEFDFEKVLMTPRRFRAVASRRRVTEMLGESPTLEMINNWLTDRNLPYIELVTGRHTLETNGVVTNFAPWNDNHVAFIPAGTLGIVHNALAIEEIRPVEGVDYAISDRILVSKFAQTEPFGEYTRGEIAAFPGFEAADNTLIVNVMADAWA